LWVVGAACWFVLVSGAGIGGCELGRLVGIRVARTGGF
jgi:hypothetical protein